MSLEDKTVVCEECGGEFVHSVEDQERYAERGFTNDPKRCRECREKRKSQHSEWEPKTLVCADCEKEFIHSAKDQAYYAERGFTNEPKRCHDCRAKRKTQAARSRGRGDRPRPGRDRPGGGRDAARGSFEAVCAECGTKTTVPFKPTQGRPVYCRDCYRSKRR